MQEYDQNGILTDTSVVNGGMTVSTSQATVNAVCETTNAMTGSYFSVSYNGEAASFFNFNITETDDTNYNYAVSYNVTLDISTLPGSVKIETLAPIVGVETDPYPTSGHIKITANSPVAGVPAIIEVEIDSSVVDGEITLTVDVDGTPGTDAGYPKTLSWAQFDGLS